MHKRWISLAISIGSLVILIVSTINIVVIIESARSIDQAREHSATLAAVVGTLAVHPPPPTGTPTGSLAPTARLESELIPSPTPGLFAVGPIDFSRSAEPITIIIGDGEGAILIPAFTPYTMADQRIDEADVFAAEQNSGLAWEPDGLHLGLWLHSGTLGGEGLTMYEFQRAIEENESGNRRDPREIEDALDELVRGQYARVIQGDCETGSCILADFKIVSAARIAPERVEESQQFLEVGAGAWLRDHVPDARPELLASSDTFFIRTCGRQAVGEQYDQRRPHWQQSRFIIGFEFVTAYRLESFQWTICPACPRRS